MINFNFIKLFMDLLIVNFLGSIILLFIGTQLLVNASITLSNKLSVNRIIIGFTVVSLATSLPELFVTLGASLRGYNDFAIGNIIGSNISNISLVLGFTAIISPLLFSKKEIFLNYIPLMLVSTLFVFLLIFVGILNLISGIVSIFLLIGFNIYLFKKGSDVSQLDNSLDDKDVFVLFGKRIRIHNIIFLIFILFSGSIVLWLGSELLIHSSKSIALKLGISDRVISITLVALGTSLPELFSSIYAAYKKETKLAIGNLLGSNIFNILAVLGATTCINQIIVDTSLYMDAIIMLVITLLLLPCFYCRSILFNHKNSQQISISRIEGIMLLLIYISYITFTLLSK